MSNKENKEEVKIDKWWIQTLVSIAVVLVGMAIIWGIYSTRVNDLEKQVSSLQEDHDTLISLNAKVDDMAKDIDGIKRVIMKYTEKEIK